MHHKVRLLTNPKTILTAIIMSLASPFAIAENWEPVEEKVLRPDYGLGRGETKYRIDTLSKQDEFLLRIYWVNDRLLTIGHSTGIGYTIQALTGGKCTIIDQNGKTQRIKVPHKQFSEPVRMPYGTFSANCEPNEEEWTARKDNYHERHKEYVRLQIELNGQQEANEADTQNNYRITTYLRNEEGKFTETDLTHPGGVAFSALTFGPWHFKNRLNFSVPRFIKGRNFEGTSTATFDVSEQGEIQNIRTEDTYWSNQTAARHFARAISKALTNAELVSLNDKTASQNNEIIFSVCLKKTPKDYRHSSRPEECR